ncbi:MAG: tetratricopeptide repeat protein [Acidobacteria bacterium]|nr:tetratricopeptide repeat protein [Acidobacteriota bacterium]
MPDILPLREPASRKFTDRDEPKALFRHALETLHPSRCRVIVWYGVGGQGKTALRNEFERLVSSHVELGHPVALSVLDFDRPLLRSPIEGMLHLRFELAAAGMKFPTFDIAFAQLFALEYPGEDIRQRHPGLLRGRENELLSDLLELAEGAKEAIFGVKLLYKYGTRLAGWLGEWWATVNARSEIGRLQGLPANKLREQLPAFLGADITRDLSGPKAPRLVVMLDAYEALWRGAPRGAQENLRVDDWVRTFVEHARGALVLVFCRDQLRWSELNSKWDGVLEQHLLGGLSDSDADRFLKDAGVHSPHVRERIVEAAQGLPFYLDLSVDSYEHVRDVDDRQPTVADFGKTPGEVFQRFLDHLSDTEVEDLEMASYLDVIDESLLTDTSRTLRGRLPDWPRLCQRSYVTRGGDDTLVMHAVMRSACQDREKRLRPSFFKSAHGFLSKHLETRALSPTTSRDVREHHESALLAAVRHRMASGEPDLVQWLMQRQKLFLDAGRFVMLEQAFALVDEAVGTLPSSGGDDDGAWFYHHYANVLQHLGANARAKAMFQRAVDSVPKDDGNRSSAKYATMLDAIANVCVEMGDCAEAEPLYAAARAIYETDPDSYAIRHAYTLLNLARCHERRGRADEAAALYDAASTRFEALAATHPRAFAGFLLDLGRVRQAQGRPGEAVGLFERASTIYSRPDGDPDGAAVVLLELASSAAVHGDAKTDVLFERATAAHERTFGAQHPNTGRALYLEAVWWLRSSPRRSAGPQLARATEILSESLGDEHPWTIEARG